MQRDMIALLKKGDQLPASIPRTFARAAAKAPDSKEKTQRPQL
jgi:hypothetical protein